MKISKYSTEGYYDPTAYAVLKSEASNTARQLMVYICSPYRGDVKKNTENAVRYCRFAYDDGVIPIAPHLMFPAFLNDDNPRERRAAMRFNTALLGKCDELWVFGDKVSVGMAEEIHYAEKQKMIIRYFKEEDLI